jgi:F-type H+-transporting ATPase subunit a
MVISNKINRFILAILIVFLPVVGFATAHDGEKQTDLETTTPSALIGQQNKVESKDGLKAEIKEFIAHHLLDSHSFHFNADKETGEHYGFSLPIILWDNGFQVFSSGEFHHGSIADVAEHNGSFYKLHHEKIYKTDEKGTLTEEHGHPTNVRPLDLSITKSVVGILLVSILMLIIFISLAKSYAKNAGISKGIGRFFEPLVLYVRDEIAIPNIGEKAYKKYMSYLLTIFFFIFFLNILGLAPFGFNVTGNITITLSLALLTLSLIHI